MKIRVYNLLVAFAMLMTVCLTSAVTWQLEDYNSWNLPFAKTVLIAGRKGLSDPPYVDGDYGHDLTLNQYKLEVDPSALFSIIFVAPELFTDYDPDYDIVALNYTLLGSEVMKMYKGVWVDVKMTVPTDLNNLSEKNYTADLTIFVAITDLPPDSGLQGTLSVAVTPELPGWKAVSLLYQLEQKSLPKAFISFVFE